MIQTIYKEKQLLAIIIRASYNESGIKFFTPDEFSQQLAYMNRPAGYVIPPHVHNLVDRQVALTQEVLFIRQGKLRVDFYDDHKIYLESTVLTTGDVILLAAGGHGFEMLEPTEMIEVKQGPYCGEADKVRFDPIHPNKANIK
ncbi:MAG TPA: hypothetical protein VGM41_17105 [Chitinophagaceae bacterium]|jgi:mannose-6-phosphate isomerase-like protein (cupin superfamily)